MPIGGKDGAIRARDPQVERFALAAVRERWIEFLPFEHAALPAPIDYGLDGEDFLVRRAPVPLRRIADGRIAAAHGPALLLQAAAFLSTLQSVGFWADARDLLDAAWDVERGTARLWVTRTPAGVAGGAPAPAVSSVLLALLDRLFARAGRLRDPAAQALGEVLRCPEAPWRRAQFWVASVFRSFPGLAGPQSAPARTRTMGSAGVLLRSATERAVIEKGRAILGGRTARVFSPPGRPFTPGAAIGRLDAEEPCGVSAAARTLREEHSAASGSRRAVWICIGMDGWDAVSRAALSTAAVALGGAVEIVRVPDTLPPPALADEWRREVSVPCGTVHAALRFAERLAELSALLPTAPRDGALAMVADDLWAAYVSDPTGDAPLPPAAPPGASANPGAPAPSSRRERELLEALAALDAAPEPAELAAFFPRWKIAPLLARLIRRGLLIADGAGRPRLCAGVRAEPAPERRKVLLLRWSDAAASPERRIERLLAAGDTPGALAVAERWHGDCAERSVESWFELSARLAAAVPGDRPPWLESLEAERELSGGRLREAEACLARLARSPRSQEGERRAARLRLAEVAAMKGRGAEAGRAAVAWLAESPDAPISETIRALLLESAAASREGEVARALSLLDRVEAAAGLTASRRVEIALARAAVLSRAGRFAEESAVYERFRPLVRQAADGTLAARFLACEALGLSDRREFPAATARLEEALLLLSDEPTERARVSIDLAATLYHAGRPARCAELLEQAAALAVGAGREDLARIARGNLVEASIDREDWRRAAAGIEFLVESAAKDGDATWSLVAFHHRSRLALRLGRLEEAWRDNRDARAIAEQIGDRLEIGELWLEEGDRGALLGDLAGARQAYARAAQDPPDRCDSDRRARERLAEIESVERGGIAAETLAASAAGRIAQGEYAAAESVARWTALFPGRVPGTLRSAAADLLRGRGGAALADIVFSSAEAPSLGDRADLRRLREILAAALSGEEPAEGRLPLGLSRISVSGARGEEVFRIGGPTVPTEAAEPMILRAGSEDYVLELWPPLSAAVLDAVALLVETLLFRPAPPAAPTEFSQGWRRFGVIASDTAMEEPYRRLTRFAPRAMTVLVLGESGVGKEAVARAVHALSPRATGPFVAVNVSAIPAALVESELFGHARGAFTGAERDRAGLLEEAARGTIFFDEIGDLAAPLQSKLLRALQDREIRRVGENRSRRIDVRVVSATSRDLAREVEAGRFREDLYYRLHVAVIALPPLRERGRDALLLARHFLAQCAKEYGRGELDLAKDAASAILSHAWPGNVRELQSAIGQAAALSDGRRIAAALLPETVVRGRAGQSGRGYRSNVNAHRRDLIMEALDRAGGNRSRAARDLRLSRQALLYLIRELKVTERPPGAGNPRSS